MFFLLSIWGKRDQLWHQLFQHRIYYILWGNRLISLYLIISALPEVSLLFLLCHIWIISRISELMNHGTCGCIIKYNHVILSSLPSSLWALNWTYSTSGFISSYLAKLWGRKARLPKIFLHLLNCSTLEDVTMVTPWLSMAPRLSIPRP